MFRTAFCLICCAALSQMILPPHLLLAEQPQPEHGARTVELLWPNGAPDALGDEDKDKPKLIVCLPPKDKATGVGIVVCPGGGYGHLAMDHEGDQIAAWLNAHGIAAFICDYRHRGKGYGHPAPLHDAQRALRTVRARAEEFGVKPNKIGILGFSAGGHLASSAGTHFDAGNATADDSVLRESCRPDFMILCYPVISFVSAAKHSGSQRNLLGDDAAETLVREMSSELQVTPNTPPTFLWHTSEDTGVPPENSILFYQACQKQGVPAELHIFAKGRHGVGLGRDIPGTEKWSQLAIEWLTAQQILEE